VVTNQRKLMTIAWHKVCTPHCKGGLGIISHSQINEEIKLKLCWELIQSSHQWTIFPRTSVKR